VTTGTGGKMTFSGNGGYFKDNDYSTYAPIMVTGTKGNYGGISFDGAFAWMNSGSAHIGLYNDTNNEWMFLGYPNGALYFYYNGVHQVSTSSDGMVRATKGAYYHNESSSYTSGGITFSTSAWRGPMTTKHNVAGVWKDPTISINVAGVWKTPDVSINVAGTWKAAYSALAVSIDVNGRTNYRENANCYAGASFYTSGVNYEYNATASLISVGNWLDSGSASDVWLLWTRTGGTLSDWNSIDSGDTRVQVTVNRSWRIVRSSNGISTIIGYWRAYDAASGGNLLDTGPTGTYSAEYDFNSCPTCCFTPDTLVTLGSGLQVRIDKVREGDQIKVKCPVDGTYKSEAVDQIIVREDTPIFRLHLHDGTHLDTSPDHPIHVRGKGYSSLHPFDYKDFGVPEQLSAGDWITHESGPARQIIRIEQRPNAPLVYTFTNMHWFANGNLVG
jgi:hypothetical protein